MSLYIEYLKEAQKWLAKAQHGDPNGGKAYQASKYVGYALQELEAAKPQRTGGCPCKFHPFEFTKHAKDCPANPAAQQSVERTAGTCPHLSAEFDYICMRCGELVPAAHR